MRVKGIDVILIVLILAIGGGYYFHSYRDRNCLQGEMLLTPEVKAFIDAEVRKIQTKRPATPGLKELNAKLLAAEQNLADLQKNRATLDAAMSDHSKAVTELVNRRKSFSADQEKFVSELKTLALNSCGKGRK